MANAQLPKEQLEDISVMRFQDNVANLTNNIQKQSSANLTDINAQIAAINAAIAAIKAYVGM